MDLKRSSLRPVEWSDRAFLHEALKRHGTPQSCECAEANLFLWRGEYGEEFIDADGRFWVIETRGGLPHFPIGEDFAPAELYQLAQTAQTWGFRPEFYDVPAAYAAQPDVERYFTVAHDDGADDYLYDLAQQAALAGPLLRKKRNLVRQFERAYPDARLDIVAEKDVPEVVQLATALNRKLHQCDFLGEEEGALAAVERYFAPLGMGGVVLRLGDGTPVGFSLFSRMADGVTFDIHFEKADHSVKGAPQTLTAKLAAHLAALGGKTMNREQDMGEPGLRQAKRSLDPCGMVERVRLIAKDKEALP